MGCKAASPKSRGLGSEHELPIPYGAVLTHAHECIMVVLRLSAPAVAGTERQRKPTGLEIPLL